MMTEDLFVRSLCEKILVYQKVPKLQVERVVGPLLGIFLENVLTEALKNDPSISGCCTIISPEWPLKKDANNQSTNIDWLVINKERKIIFLVELKTSVTSKYAKQLGLYLEIKRKVKKEGGQFLRSDLDTIARASTEKEKYKIFIRDFINEDIHLSEYRECRLIYIVPQPMVAKLRKKDHQIDHIFSFSDLPKMISGSLGTSWAIIHDTLCELEKNQKTRPIRSATNHSDRSQIIISNIKMRFPDKIPIRIWFGKTGEGKSPNYQVEFSDGAVQPFRASGQLYTQAARFNSSHLGKPIDWHEFAHGK